MLLFSQVQQELEFFSIKVADGPLTSRLQKIVAGDTVLMGKKPTGTLVLDALKGGKRLFLFGTGWKSNFLVNLGYGDVAGLFPRSPRLSFDEAARLE